jgi:membrane fusion protein, multidrug efflux system
MNASPGEGTQDRDHAEQDRTENRGKPAAARKSSLPRWIAAGVVVMLAAGGYIYWKRSQVWESTDDAEIDGYIHQISARVSGTVTKVNVQDNQYVEAGATLAELDPRPYQVAVDQAKAALAQAEADAAASNSNVPVVSNATSTQLSGAQASVDEVRASIATAQQQVQAARAKLPVVQAQVRQAQANHDRDARDVERYQMLVAKEEISRQQFDAAQAAAAASKAQVDAAQAQLEEVNHTIEVAQRQVAEQQARLTRAESDVRSAQTGPQEVAASKSRAQAAAAKVQTERANLEQAELDLSYTTIRAPVSGVARRNVETGQTVQAGQPVVTVVPLEDIWVSANYKENQLNEIRPGQPVEISVDAYGGRTYSGQVDSISPATGARFSLLPPENATGNYVKVVQRVSVKIVFDKGQDPQHLLRPGMSVVPKVRVK